MNRKGYEELISARDKIEQLSLYVNGLSSDPQYHFSPRERLKLSDVSKDLFNASFRLSTAIPGYPPEDFSKI